MNLRKLIFTESDCYKEGMAKKQFIKPIAPMWHSTAANNPYLKRYVGPDDGLLGKNIYNNHWNQPRDRRVCYHAFVGKLKDDTIASYQVLPWDLRGWHSGSGKNGNGNSLGYIGICICEDNLKDKDYAMAVYKETCELSAYICELYSLDPTTVRASRLGWVNGQFLPYDTEIMFDGEASFKNLYDSIGSEGDYDEWLTVVRDARRAHPAVRAVVASSFASVLLEPLGVLPSFTHIWSTESAAGKTVIAMLGASVWGDPDGGRYMQTFNTTEVASEKTCAFLNSLPLVMDELQTANTKQFNVYKISQGVGRARGTKEGGIEKTSSWRLMCITTGESPLVSETAGAGAIARVVDVEIEDVIFDVVAGQRITGVIRANYGHAGKKFVQAVKDIGADELRSRYDARLGDVRQNMDVQDKQMMTAAALLVADDIADEYLFQDDMGRLGLEDLAPYLKTREQVSIEQRAYDILIDWIASNGNRFDDDYPHERYGMIEGNTVYIIRKIFNEVMQDEGFSPRSVLSAMARKGMIIVNYAADHTRHDMGRRINGRLCRCVALLVLPETDTPDDENDEKWLN